MVPLFGEVDWPSLHAYPSRQGGPVVIRNNRWFCANTGLVPTQVAADPQPPAPSPQPPAGARCPVPGALPALPARCSVLGARLLSVATVSPSHTGSLYLPLPILYSEDRFTVNRIPLLLP